MSLKSYLIRVGSATSQLANVVLIGGTPNESISGRSHREGWWTERWIDFAFGKGHCRAAYDQDAIDAAEYLSRYPK